MAICRNCFAAPASDGGPYCWECDQEILNKIINADSTEESDDLYDTFYPEEGSGRDIPESKSF